MDQAVTKITPDCDKLEVAKNKFKKTGKYFMFVVDHELLHANPVINDLLCLILIDEHIENNKKIDLLE